MNVIQNDSSVTDLESTYAQQKRPEIKTTLIILPPFQVSWFHGFHVFMGFVVS